MARRVQHRRQREVDQEHQELVELINHLHGQIQNDAAKDRVGEVCFALEEMVMRSELSHLPNMPPGA